MWVLGEVRLGQGETWIERGTVGSDLGRGKVDIGWIGRMGLDENKQSLIPDGHREVPYSLGELSIDTDKLEYSIVNMDMGGKTCFYIVLQSRGRKRRN